MLPSIFALTSKVKVAYANFTYITNYVTGRVCLGQNILSTGIFGPACRELDQHMMCINITIDSFIYSYVQEQK